MFKKLLNFLKKRWAYFLYIFFVWAVPIIMLNEKVALVKTNISFKITFMGCLVVLVIFFAFRKKIFAIINKAPHGVCRGVLLCLYKGITYGLFLGILWAVSRFSGLFYNWWLLCGLSWLLGLGFLMVDEILNKEKKEDEKD